MHLERALGLARDEPGPVDRPPRIRHGWCGVYDDAARLFEGRPGDFVRQGKKGHFGHPTQPAVQDTRRNANPSEKTCSPNADATAALPARQRDLVSRHARRKLYDDCPSGFEHPHKLPKERLDRFRRIEVLENQQTQHHVEGSIGDPSQITGLVEPELTIAPVCKQLTRCVQHAGGHIDTDNAAESV